MFCSMAHACLHLLCTELVGVLGCWRNHVSYWNLARLLSLGPLTMDEDTKFVLQMWRVQVMVNDHLQRRVDALERELGDVYAGKRTDVGGADADWRASSSDRRRSDDSND
jgi:hypothetical protein